ncbi:tetratricopeptide repeat protein [Aquimarina sp. MAR_2010_214]|uniref:helix-turn-helix domain-containing protein n=1 Tax=Aquimarina sp. MAR_2010_214 TaxID=1250026 RepID=UPI000CBF8678|nr:helix-turn-helix domain-containing protein [Aquimarina sp. MAR_2010_214]PKV48224.1 tetratricopeptide repeat protein [Aquimarina sp. MAR_2010_214]
MITKNRIGEKHYSVSDSLRYKTFDELWTLYDEYRKDYMFAKEIADTYLFKAKKNKDTVEIANGYRIFFEININIPEVALAYTDSMIDITRGVKDEYYPARGYLLKGSLLQKLERYNEALESYLTAKKYAEINKNMDHIIALKHNVAILKTTLGKNKEALKVYKENFYFLITQDTVKKFRQYYIATLYKLSDSYNRLKQYDSANFYLRKGISSSILGGKNYYPDLLSCYGVNSYYRKEYTTAIDSLKKSLELSKKSTNANVIVTYLYLGKTLLKLDNEEKAIEYFKKVDSAIHTSNYILETREAFTLLIDYYKKNDDKSNQLEILEKLIKLDSSFNVKYKKLNVNIVKKYDNIQLIRDKEQLINSIENQSRITISRLWLFGGLAITLISLAYFYYYKKRKNNYEKAYHKKLLEVQNLHQKKVSRTKDIELAPELKHEILKKLEEFEKNKVFLKNDLTLSIVAKKLKTNSTYLSKIINLDKQKNFANYINDLRIEHCIEQIKNDKKFRCYSVTSMAKEVGFNNIQSFVKAFYKKNQCNPAEYIKNTDN